MFKFLGICKSAAGTAKAVAQDPVQLEHNFGACHK